MALIKQLIGKNHCTPMRKDLIKEKITFIPETVIFVSPAVRQNSGMYTLRMIAKVLIRKETKGCLTKFFIHFAGSKKKKTVYKTKGSLYLTSLSVVSRGCA